MLGLLSVWILVFYSLLPLSCLSPQSHEEHEEKSMIFQRDRIYVVSDTHLGIDEIMPESSRLDLWTFFDKLADPSTDAFLLVIAGDFVDGWLYPLNVTPRTFSEILEETTAGGVSLATKLAAILSNDVSIKITVGNHDLTLSSSDFGSDSLSSIEVFPTPGIEGINFRIAHGHEFDLFNAPDPVPNFRPLGYYCSRCGAQLGHWHSPSAPYWFLSSARDTGITRQLFGSPLAFLQLWNTLLLSGCNGQVVKDGCWYKGEDECLTKDVTHNQAFEKQSTILERWFKGLGLEAEVGKDYDEWVKSRYGTSEFELTELDYMLYVSLAAHTYNAYNHFIRKQLCHLELVVFGHTHSAMLRAVERCGPCGQEKEILYANSGTWTVDSNQGSRHSFVRLNVTSETGNLNDFSSLRAMHVELCDFNAAGTGASICQLKHWKSETPKVKALYSESIPYVPRSGRREGASECQLCDCEGMNPYLNTTCNEVTNECEYAAVPVPIEWTCDPSLFFGKTCYANCTAYDLGCVVSNVIYGCEERSHQIVVGVYNNNSSPECIYVDDVDSFEGKIGDLEPSEDWNCPRAWYGSGDGCDCFCGSGGMDSQFADRDCGRENFDDGMCMTDANWNGSITDPWKLFYYEILAAGIGFIVWLVLFVLSCVLTVVCCRCSSWPCPDEKSCCKCDLALWILWEGAVLLLGVSVGFLVFFGVYSPWTMAASFGMLTSQWFLIVSCVVVMVICVVICVGWPILYFCFKVGRAEQRSDRYDAMLEDSG